VTDRPAGSAEANGPPDVIELRMRRLWVVFPSVLAVVLGVGAPDVLGRVIGVAILVAWAVGTSRSYIRMQDAIVYRRLGFWWSKPLDLSRLVYVDINHWEFFQESPHFIWVEDEDGHVIRVSRTFWANASSLLPVIAWHASAPFADDPLDRRFRVEVRLSKSARRTLPMYV
jgi:hypothetical protein